MGSADSKLAKGNKLLLLEISPMAGYMVSADSFSD